MYGLVPPVPSRQIYVYNAKGLRAGRSRNWGWRRGTGPFFLHCAQTCCGTHPFSYPVAEGGPQSQSVLCGEEKNLGYCQEMNPDHPGIVEVELSRLPNFVFKHPTFQWRNVIHCLLAVLLNFKQSWVPE